MDSRKVRSFGRKNSPIDCMLIIVERLSKKQNDRIDKTTPYEIVYVKRPSKTVEAFISKISNIFEQQEAEN